MRELLSPNQVSKAIQASESSVKRWCDKGLIPTRYTAGGHRRIPVSGLFEFLREVNCDLIQPDILGLPAAKGRKISVIDRAVLPLTEAILAGDETAARRIVFDLYRGEHSICKICDLVIANAFAEIGERFACGDVEVYQERRGCEITSRVLHELLTVTTAASPSAPTAIGGATVGDRYQLATTMVELVLKDAGWNAVSLGDNLPWETLAAAIGQHRPRLFWLCCSHLDDEDSFIKGYSSLYNEFAETIAFVVEGTALNEKLRRSIKYTAYCDNMQHLEATAATIR